jgi:hypothetical protein
MIVIPRKSYLTDKLISRSGLAVTVLEWCADILPLTGDFFLVPCPTSFRKCFVEDDISDVYTITRALSKLAFAHGYPTRVFTAGGTAARVGELFAQQAAQLQAFSVSQREFDDFFIIDRTVDLMTPLLTQTTYGGLLDEYLGNHYGWVELPKGVSSSKDEADLFSPADSVFPQVRALRMDLVGVEIMPQAREAVEIAQTLQDTRGSRDWNAKALRAAELVRLQPFFALHIDLGIEIQARRSLYFTDVLNFEAEAIHGQTAHSDLAFRLMNLGETLGGLRLLCLKSVLQGGLGSSTFEELEKRLLADVGVEAVADVAGLERSGLLASAKFFGGSVKLLSAVEKLKALIRGGEDAELGSCFGLDQDFAYVPLLVRLVQAGLAGEWKPGGSAAKALEQIDVRFAVTGEEAPVAQTLEGAAARRVLVFVVGGVTDSEAVIFQQLGRVAFEEKVEVHLGSTTVISGQRLIAEVCPSLRKQAH